MLAALDAQLTRPPHPAPAPPQPALPPAPAAAAEGSPGAMGPLARARAEALGLSTKRSPDGSVDGEVGPAARDWGRYWDWER